MQRSNPAVRPLPRSLAADAAASSPRWRSVFPIAWFKFHPMPQRRRRHERGEIEYSLARPRCTRYLLARLVSAENRMAEMSDDHAQPNIDIEHLGAKGYLVATEEA